MKKDWVVITTGHERYSFGTDIHIYRNMTFEELKEELYIYDDEKIESYRPDHYLIDECYHADLDTKYEYPQFKGLPLEKIGLDVTMITTLDALLKDEYESWIWGSTETKFGLIDKKRKEE